MTICLSHRNISKYVVRPKGCCNHIQLLTAVSEIYQVIITFSSLPLLSEQYSKYEILSNPCNSLCGSNPWYVRIAKHVLHINPMSTGLTHKNTHKLTNSLQSVTVVPPGVCCRNKCHKFYKTAMPTHQEPQIL